MFRRSLLIALTLVVLGAPPAVAQDADVPVIEDTTLGDGYVDITGTGCAPNIPISSVTSVVEPFSGIRGASDPSVKATTDMTHDDGSFALRAPLGSEPGRYESTVTCGDLVQKVRIDVGEQSIASADTDPGVPVVRLVVVVGAAALLALFADRRRRAQARARV